MELQAVGRERAYGPYEERGGWRVTVVGTRGNRASRVYSEWEEANAVVQAIRAKTEAKTVGGCVHEYLAHLRLKGNKARSIRTTQHRLTRLIKPVYDRPITSLTFPVADKLYAQLSQELAADTHRNALGQARTWGRWLVKQRLLKRNPWQDVLPVGERNYGKDQLRIDEARKVWRWIKPRLSTDPGALAVGIVLLLGLRAGEVVAIVARDIDAGGTILWIDRGKTRRARRQLMIPPPLQAPLKALAAEGGRLFPHWAKWVLDACKRCAGRAGIAGNVTAHGLRGLHATLKVEYEAAQMALGHKPGSDVTEKHYLAPGTIERATARRVWEVLDAEK